MPIYEYECGNCHFRVERVELTPDPNQPTCPRCEHEENIQLPMDKVISASNPVFVGDGWCRPASYKPERGPAA